MPETPDRDLPTVDAPLPGTVVSSRAAEILGVSSVEVRRLARAGTLVVRAWLRGSSGGKPAMLLDEESIWRRRMKIVPRSNRGPRGGR